MRDVKVRCAILSVYDKSGIVEFAKGLSELGIRIISTGGTAKLIKENGIEVVPIEDITGFPEMMDGRVKTLHPKIHGGILAKKDNPEHIEAMKKYGIESIDMVCVNLYPFVKVTSQENCSFEDAIENIDIGGPTMIRSAAKNHQYVVVVTSPKYYGFILDELRRNDCKVGYEIRLLLAREAFRLTAEYDYYIQDYLADNLPKCEDESVSVFPSAWLNLSYKVKDLRYGENPHQKSALYYDAKSVRSGWGDIKQLGGKELSFNNIVDANAALELVMEFTEKPTCCVIKHTNPCGCACDEDIVEAYRKAYLGDPNAAMGGIIAFNRKINAELADAIMDSLARWGKDAGAGAFFAEIIIAPDFDEDAIEIIRTKKRWGENVRLLKVNGWNGKERVNLPEDKLAGWDVKRVRGGFLIQTRDEVGLNEDQWKVVSKRRPTEDELRDLKFGWLVCKHVKSNAIVVVKGERLLGVGAGQMSRVNSTRLATEQAGDECKGAVLASDAFFPFRDSIDYAHKLGITAVIEPGGSKRDEEVIQAADEYDIALVFTGVRHFKH